MAESTYAPDVPASAGKKTPKSDDFVVDLRSWLPKDSLKNAPPVTREELENEFEIPYLCIYYSSRTFIVLCVLTLVILTAIYIAQGILELEKLPGSATQYFVETYVNPTCDPGKDKYCLANRYQCDLGKVNTCAGGITPRTRAVAQT